MKIDDCISAQDLKAFASGQLDESRSEEIVAHLAGCARCEETIAGMDQTGDSLLAAVREAAGSGPEIPVEESAAAVLRQIANPWATMTDKSTPASAGEWVRDYELLEPLGNGGMGTVYKAVHVRLQRIVAIKLLPAARLRDAAAVARFEREMQAIGRLQHPAIVRATDAGDVDGTHFLVMDFVDGIDLSELVRLTGPMDAASACEVIRQAALGLQYAHEQGLIHRDVKPGNLMVELPSQAADAAGVKLLDLGLALFGAASEAVDELTTVGQLMGTLDYMAPEQADDSHNVDARADVYSLGATMFRLLTGTAPYETSQRRTPLQKMKALATVDAPPVKTRRSDLPDAVAAIVDRMLLRDPAARYQTAAEVALAVAAWCPGHRLEALTHQALQARAVRIREVVPRISAAAAGLPAGLSRRVSTADPLRNHRSVSAAPVIELPPRRDFRRILLSVAGLVFLLAAGLTWRIQTDQGTLVIECTENKIPVEIRQGSRKVRGLTLSAGVNSVTLRSGSYEIVVPAEYDSMHVENGMFELRRGDQWVARITQSPPPSATAAEAGPANSAQREAQVVGSSFYGMFAEPERGALMKLVQPTYSGKSFEDWCDLTRAERNPEELKKAVEAIGILGKGTRDAEATAAVLDVVDRTPFDYQVWDYNRPNTLLVSTALRAISRLGADEAADTMASRFDSGSPFVQAFIITGLRQDAPHFSAPSSVTVTGQLGTDDELSAVAIALTQNAQFVNRLVEVLITEFGPGQTSAPADSVPRTAEFRPFGLRAALWEQSAIFDVITRHVGTNPPRPEIERFLRRLVATADSTSPGHRVSPKILSRAASILARHWPDKAYADIFVRGIQAEVAELQDMAARVPISKQDLQPMLEIWKSLASLGRQAEPSLPYLYEILSHRPVETVGFSRADRNSFLSASFFVYYHASDPQAFRRTASPIVMPRYLEINLRLLAIEVIAATRTSDPKALELLRAEFRRTVSQEPADGPFEFTPWRGFFLLPAESDPTQTAQSIWRQSRVPDPKEPHSLLDVELTNSSLLAWKVLTGASPRFATASLGELRHDPPGMFGVATSPESVPKIVRPAAESPEPEFAEPGSPEPESAEPELPKN